MRRKRFVGLLVSALVAGLVGSVWADLREAPVSDVVAANYSTARDGSVISGILAKVGSRKVNVILDTPGPWIVTNSLALPANARLTLAPDARMTVYTNSTLTAAGGMSCEGALTVNGSAVVTGLACSGTVTGTGTLDVSSYLDALRKSLFGASVTVRVLGKGFVVYPEWWGAASDGTTDCGSAIERASIAARTNVVQFSEGVYQTTTSIGVVGGNTLRGSGVEKTIIRKAAGAASNQNWIFASGDISAGAQSYITVEHMTLDCNRRSNTGTDQGGVWLIGGQGNVVRDVRVQDVGAASADMRGILLTTASTSASDAPNIVERAEVMGFRSGAHNLMSGTRDIYCIENYRTGTTDQYASPIVRDCYVHDVISRRAVYGINSDVIKGNVIRDLMTVNASSVTNGGDTVALLAGGGRRTLMHVSDNEVSNVRYGWQANYNGQLQVDDVTIKDNLFALSEPSTTTNSWAVAIFVPTNYIASPPTVVRRLVCKDNVVSFTNKMSHASSRLFAVGAYRPATGTTDVTIDSARFCNNAVTRNGTLIEPTVSGDLFSLAVYTNFTGTAQAAASAALRAKVDVACITGADVVDGSLTGADVASGDFGIQWVAVYTNLLDDVLPATAGALATTNYYYTSWGVLGTSPCVTNCILRQLEIDLSGVIPAGARSALLSAGWWMYNAGTNGAAPDVAVWAPEAPANTFLIMAETVGAGYSETQRGTFNGFVPLGASRKLRVQVSNCNGCNPTDPYETTIDSVEAYIDLVGYQY